MVVSCKNQSVYYLKRYIVLLIRHLPCVIILRHQD